MTAFRESIAETLSTVSKAKARSATLWRRVEKLRAFFLLEEEKRGIVLHSFVCLGYFCLYNLFSRTIGISIKEISKAVFKKLSAIPLGTNISFNIIR